jgi:hypothetical protein
MSRIIELPDELYENLERAAREQGFTLVDWIANAVPATTRSADSRPLIVRLEGLIGLVNSAETPPDERRRTPFSELLSRKFERQGLRGA